MSPSPPLSFLRWLLLCGWLCWPSGLRAQAVFINELHYDNVSTDADEGIEIAGPAGTDLGGYSLVFYNGTNTPAAAPLSALGTVNLTGVLTDLGAGYGLKWFAIPGIENGGSDGVVLYKNSSGQIVQFLSWEGTLTAGVGVAAGLTSVNLPVAESGPPAVGTSLQLTGTGTTYSQFTWAASAGATRDALNNFQTLGSVVYSSSMALSVTAVDETAGATTVVGTVTLNPPPSSPRTITLSSADLTEATVPASVTVGTTGTATFPVTVINDGIMDGTQIVSITMSDATARYPSKSVALTVRDVDAPPPAFTGVLRVACQNVLFGVNAPGSTAYVALREQLARIDPQVIAFEEMDAAGNFAEVKTMLNELGFITTPQYFATVGDGFTTFVPGDLATSTTQVLCLASRFPITAAVQIGRGVAGRSEMTRYPLFVKVDVPGVPAESDPAFVVVHLKANSGATIVNESDRFRRALELYRVTQFLTTQGFDAAGKNAFVLGDFNERDDLAQTTSYPTAGINPASYQFADGSTLPASMVLGSDLTTAPGVTLPYDRFPHAALAPLHLVAPETRQADGSTRITYNAGGTARLDYIFAKESLTSAGLYVGEVYNSRLESACDGLPKAGAAPTAETSYLASDHFAVFADVALSLMPKLTLTAPVAWVNEASTSTVNLTLTLTLTLSAAPGAQPVIVTLSEPVPGRIRLPVGSVTFTGSQTTANIPVEILHPPAVDPHRLVTVLATAPNWFNGKATLEIRNQEAGGALVISQYLEPLASSGPKAVELWNQAGATLDFTKQPLTIKRYTNGDATGVNEARVEFGILDAGQVLVIGDSATGEYLLTQGLIQPDATLTPTSAPSGTAFYDAAGRLKFWKDSFTYNGNDALEVLFNFTRMDVLGTIGQDPGNAWAGSGVSTQNQSLGLRAGLATGTSGFTDPSTRFTTVSTTDALTGFGVPPTGTDNYLLWASGNALSGLDRSLEADPDGDALANLLEYALNSNPHTSTAGPLVLSGAQLAITIRQPLPLEPLTYGLEASPDLHTWTSSALLGTSEALANGMQTLRWTLPLTGGHSFYRFVVKRG